MACYSAVQLISMHDRLSHRIEVFEYPYNNNNSMKEAILHDYEHESGIIPSATQTLNIFLNCHVAHLKKKIRA